MSIVKVLEGSEAVALAVKACRPQVISAYPISPQTHIVEGLARLVADGALESEYVRVGVESGLIPLFEMEKGKITNVRKIKKKVPVEAYLKLQKRFRHLLNGDSDEKEIARIQTIADANIKEFGLITEERS